MGQFKVPIGIAVDSADNVYVVDNDNNRVQKFDSNGNFITTWGSEGSAVGQFKVPIGIAVDSAGNAYVTDFYENSIQKFDSNGNFITTWGSYGTGNGQFNWPTGITVDSSGNVYVADSGNNRIEVFAPVNQNQTSSNNITQVNNIGNTTVQSHAGISDQF